MICVVICSEEGRERKAGRGGDEEKKVRREQREKSGWTVLSSNAKFLKHEENLRK